MISKKVPTVQQKVLLKCIDAFEVIGQNINVVAAVGITCLALVINQKVLNSRTFENCPTSINALVTHRTVLGDAVVCVSRVELYGPRAPLPD